MNSLRVCALSTAAGVCLLLGCSSDSPPSTGSTSEADTNGLPELHLTAFEKRLKLARLPPGIGVATEAVFDVAASTSHPGYPAFAPDVPTLMSQGGPTIKHPRIVTVTWDGDVNRDVYEKFGDQIGASTYWHDTTSEYGVGPAVSGPANHVHIAEPLTKIADDEVDALVRANLTNAASGWPATTDETIYTLYLPANALTFGGQDACNTGIGGYHTDSPLDLADGGSSKEFNYAVIINCPAKWDVHTVTLIASHELDEATTDPFPSAQAGFVGLDPDHLAFDMSLQFQDENGDACEFFKSSDYVGGAPFAFGLQRSWSNRSAKAGHNPCVPRTKLPYFNVTTFPSAMDKIHVDLTALGDTVQTTSGFKAALNQARTFDIGFYSDAPTGADWTVWAKLPQKMPVKDQNNAVILNGQATATIDRPSGHNGHRAKVTVTPTQFNALGVIYLELHSVLQGGEERVFPGELTPLAKLRRVPA